MEQNYYRKSTRRQDGWRPGRMTMTPPEQHGLHLIQPASNLPRPGNFPQGPGYTAPQLPEYRPPKLPARSFPELPKRSFPNSENA